MNDKTGGNLTQCVDGWICLSSELMKLFLFKLFCYFNVRLLNA